MGLRRFVICWAVRFVIRTTARNSLLNPCIFMAIGIPRPDGLGMTAGSARRWNATILIAQTRLPVFHWNASTLDEHLLHVGLHIQWVAVGDHDVCRFSDVQRA